jgi:hypothetical protein
MRAVKLSILTCVVENTLENLGKDSWVHSNLEPARKYGNFKSERTFSPSVSGLGTA